MYYAYLPQGPRLPRDTFLIFFVSAQYWLVAIAKDYIEFSDLLLW